MTPDLHAIFDSNNVLVSDACELASDAAHSFRQRSTVRLPDCHPSDLLVLLKVMGYTCRPVGLYNTETQVVIDKDVHIQAGYCVKHMYSGGAVDKWAKQFLEAGKG